MAKRFKTLDSHELLDVANKSEIVLRGLRYAVLYQDIDTLRKCMTDLRNCVLDMNEIVEEEFGKE
tara:strand:+ start:9142 stop:9336 length:195 start_codon:yes stop_codon:yes gene_type:complete